MFYHQIKHLEVGPKYSTESRIFNSLLAVQSGDETLCLMFDIFLQTIFVFASVVQYSHCNLFDQLPLPLSGPEESQVDHLRLGHLVQGYQQLHSAGLLLPSQVQCRFTLMLVNCGCIVSVVNPISIFVPVSITLSKDDAQVTVSKNLLHRHFHFLWLMVNY